MAVPDLRMRAPSRRPLAIAGTAALALGLATPLLAGPFMPLGDGSGYDNPDLVGGPADACDQCTPHAPAESNTPWFDIDWSLALRGAYVQTTDGSYFEASAVPSVTLSHQTLRGGYDVTASAELTRSEFEEWRIGSASAALTATYRLDRDTLLSGGINLSLSQAGASAPGADPTIAVHPQIWSGDANAQVARDFGPFVAAARGNVARTVYGPTTLTDASLVDNSDQSNWRAGTGLRLGYRLTPILTPFVDASIGYQVYDAPSPVHLVPLDAMDLEARAGVSARWTSVFEAEASIGYGVRRFADPALEESGTILFDASVTARPDETLELRASFSTSHGAPGADSPGTARLEYAAAASLAYRVNPWLALRGSAGWTHAEVVGTADTEDGHRFGAGADFILTEHTTVTADYGYTQTTRTPGTTEDEHRVTLGVVLRR